MAAAEPAAVVVVVVAALLLLIAGDDDNHQCGRMVEAAPPAAASQLYPAAHDQRNDGYNYEKVVGAAEAVDVPALFAFGDSLLDTGNNNGLRTIARANFRPYGRDFPPTHAPTGRFTNGYNALDFLAFKLGLPITPITIDPSTRGAKLLQGVNYASAGSGIQPNTGRFYGQVLSLDKQIQQFARDKLDIIATIGANATDNLLSRALFYALSGSNDWLTTYLGFGSPLPKKYSRTQYRDLLVATFISQMKELYNLGARRVAVVGLGAFGCCPSQMRTFKSVNGTCVGWLNDLAKDFNYNLRIQVLELSKTLPGSQFSFQDPYAALLAIHDNPSAYGYTVVDHACCGIGKYGGFLNCFPRYYACDNVEKHLFWDAYHPTSRFQEQFVDLVWNNGPPYSYPSSAKQLLLTKA